MKIFAVRHGQTDLNAENRVQGGRSDLPLNSKGREQAHMLADELSSCGIDVIVTSTRKRAEETAQIINERLNVEIIKEPRLIERDFGDFEGGPVSEVDILSLRRWRDNAPTPNGETIRETAYRVFAALDEIIKRFDGQNVLIVAHGHVVRSILWYFNGLPKDGEDDGAEIGNCAVYEFDVKKDASGINIRNMTDSDVAILTAAELAQGWHISEDKFLQRLRDAKSEKCVALVAEYDGQPAGYVNVYFQVNTGAFANQNLPAIVDFGVLEKHRHRGIGTALMDMAEKLAGEHSDTVVLGVGLHSGYGAAQGIYVKRGYIPDGTGVWYQDRVCEPYSGCCNDDDLIIYMSKKLRKR